MGEEEPIKDLRLSQKEEKEREEEERQSTAHSGDILLPERAFSTHKCRRVRGAHVNNNINNNITYGA